MSKNPLNKKELEKVIKTTQAIEGYTNSNESSTKQAKALMERYGIKVSTKRK